MNKPEKNNEYNDPLISDLEYLSLHGVPKDQKDSGENIMYKGHTFHNLGELAEFQKLEEEENKVKRHKTAA